LGALNERKNDLTKVGQMMARMPIDPRLARMIIGGAHFGVLKETLIIVSALAIQDPRETTSR
jgi:ATP-dependent helicase HrpA